MSEFAASIDFSQVRKYAQKVGAAGASLLADLDAEMERQADRVMRYAKQERFVRIASPNETYEGPRGGKKLVNPPVPGILTMRSGNYLRSITMVRQGPSDYFIIAPVVYAARHEKDRPVLTAALKARKKEAIKAIQKRVMQLVPKGL